MMAALNLDRSILEIIKEACLLFSSGPDGKGRMTTSLLVLTAICATIVWVESCYADCSSLRALAQQHANDMARRKSRSCWFHGASWAGGCRRRECSDGMRDRGLCKANVDAVAARSCLAYDEDILT